MRNQKENKRKEEKDKNIFTLDSNFNRKTRKKSKPGHWTGSALTPFTAACVKALYPPAPLGGRLPWPFNGSDCNNKQNTQIIIITIVII